MTIATTKKKEKKKKKNENLTETGQNLEAVPAEEIDVMKLIAENISKKKKKNGKLSNKESYSEFEVVPKRVATNKEFEFSIPKLKLEDKIQFRIATINFNSGSSQLTFKDIKKIKKVMKLANEKNAKVRIVGHASTRTKDMDLIKHKLANFTISDKRSHAVAKVFIDNKFPIGDLITEAVSDSKPLFHESMPAGTHGNQRTEIYIIY